MGTTKGRENITMKNTYTLRNQLNLIDYNTAITREDFEKHFTKTHKKVRFTFNGWDGKSYHGESRNASVYRTDFEGFEDERFIKVGNHLCYIDDERSILEMATGDYHPEAEWLVEVKRG